MASTVLTFSFISVCCWTLGSSNEVTLKLEAHDHHLQKYVGDSLSLTCTITGHTEEDSKVKYIWVLPTSNKGVARQEDSAAGGGSTLTITHLDETDGGSYVCQVENSLDERFNAKATLDIVVLPRGRVSHCSNDSFRCTAGHCIPNRYKCDGHRDCPHDGSDENIEHCGVDACAGKLQCRDGRCLSRQLCCRESNLSHTNCTITASILCCRQLMHPALLDQDLFYLEMRPNINMQHRMNRQPDSTLVMGCIVAVANLVTVAIIVGVRYHLWRSNNNNNNNNNTSSSGAHYHLSRLRSATLRSFGISSAPCTTDQYQLRSADPLFPRRVPGLRSDLLAPEILHSQRQNQGPYSGVILCPPAHSQPPHYSQLHTPPQGPPPSYHQVVGAPPPPYYSRDDLTMSSVSDESSLSLLAPLLSHNIINNNNNNNGDINGNNTLQLNVHHNHNNNNNNHNQSAPSTSTPLQPSTPQVRNK